MDGFRADESVDRKSMACTDRWPGEKKELAYLRLIRSSRDRYCEKHPSNARTLNLLLFLVVKLPFSNRSMYL